MTKEDVETAWGTIARMIQTANWPNKVSRSLRCGGLRNGQVRFFALWLVLLSSVSLTALADPANDTFPERFRALELRLDAALDEHNPDYEERAALVVEADTRAIRARASSIKVPESLRLKTRLVEGILNLRMSEFELSQQQLGELCPSIGTIYPNLKFRCESMFTATQLILGDRIASLRGYERLLDGDLSAVEPGLQARARINYAAVLSESGRSAEAADIYEQQMIVALVSGDDPLALYAGNNLVVILMTQGDYVAAEETLRELDAVLGRNPESMVSGSLRLHELELMRVAGQHAEAAEELKKFIASTEDRSPLMLGSAHKMLGDALRGLGQLEEALAQIQVGIDYFGSQRNETIEARLSKAQVLLELERYDGALEELALIDIESERVPARRVRAHNLELQALLSRSGEQQSLATLAALSDADAERDRLASTTRSEYFDARLSSARKELEVQQAEARTMAAIEKNKQDHVRRNQTIFLLGVAAIVACLLIYLLVNRRAERRSLQEKDAQNAQLGLLVAAKTRELTDNLRAQGDMAKALERKKRSEAIGLLAGNVAHDFNNLLQVIASSNETLANPNSGPQERATVLDISERSLEHASRIIRQLLAYSRQQELAANHVRFGDYLKNTQALLRSATGEEHELIIEDCSENAALLVDPAQLTTSLLNLISNASDAMTGGGTVTLTAEARSIDNIQAKRWNDISAGEFLMLSVRDTGVGMTPEQVARASEPFFTTKNLQMGTGLGLSSVFGFVKQSSGDLQIISGPEEGTIVRILLPLTTRGHVDAPTSSPEAELKLEGKRVLLVEDNQSVAMVLQSVLHQIGFKTEHAYTGETAQALLGDDPNFDYVLSDVRMPGTVNGPALARWIMDQHPEIQVMLMSGFNELGSEDIDLPLISKPFHIEQLKRFIREQSATT